MKQIKYLIFGLRNVLFQSDPGSNKGKSDFNAPYVEEFRKLIAFVRSLGIQPVVFANHSWTMGDGQDVQTVFDKAWGPMRWLTANGGSIPFKPQAASMQAVLNQLKADPNEVLYIGNTDEDMQTAVNGGVLFLNAVWVDDNNDYGFRFDSPKAVAKFIDVFCIRSRDWAFSIDDGTLRFRSLAPYSTMLSQYETYSADARDTKSGAGQPEFWGRYLCATMLLSGLYKDFQYVCPFPRHTAHAWNEPLRESLETFAKCFRKSYIPDLVDRHTTILSSRLNPDALGHTDHLSSIQLTEHPTRNAATHLRYKRSPLGTGKTVLVVDDFCTRGRSIEAARLYLEQTGSKVILVTWLKTINRDYNRIVSTGGFKFRPYQANDWKASKLALKAYPYASAKTDDDAHTELDAKFRSYRNWNWPQGL